jgi:hypoxanthine phosphoribosyltransferase
MRLELLIHRDEIKRKVREIADKISRDYKNKNPILVGVLKGSIVFLSDLMRELKIPVEIDFVKVKSYVGMKSDKIEVKLDVENVEGRDIILVEDIVDTGNTVDFLLRRISLKNPNSIKVCSLLDKPERREVDVKVDYVGFTVPDVFVVGYGLDVNNRYRELPDIYYIKQTTQKS